MKTMKTSFSRFVKLLLAATLFVLMLGVTASAADVYVRINQVSTNGYVYQGRNVNTYDTRYHVITVPKDGYLTVGANKIYTYSSSNTSYYYGMNIELYDTKLKRLDNQTEYVDANGKDYVFYGLKKGIYYIKTTGAQNYNLIATHTPWTNKGGTSKAKARTIKANKLQKGIMPAGEKANAADWYKFKVTKKKVLYIDIDTANNGYFDFYLYGPNFKNGTRLCSFNNKGDTFYTINSLTRKKMKVSTGTYYIKVVRSTSSKKASGAYTVKWRLK